MKKFLVLVAGVTVLAAATASTALANHSWGGYHWARTSNPFTLKVGDNLTTSEWKTQLAQTSGEWSQSTVLDTAVVAGQTKGRCKATTGRDEVCNGTYGKNGWLGLATIWIAGGSHITQGTVKLNDTYFALPAYNNTAEKKHVVCQEVGHTLGLDHQSETGASLNTCMDYYDNTSSADTKSTTPNAHDYQQLETIYAHLDSTTTVGSTAKLVPTGAVGESKYVTQHADGTEITYVRWATPIHRTF
jgi:hypothetical protein